MYSFIILKYHLFFIKFGCWFCRLLFYFWLYLNLRSQLMKLLFNILNGQSRSSSCRVFSIIHNLVNNPIAIDFNIQIKLIVLLLKDLIIDLVYFQHFNRILFLSYDLLIEEIQYILFKIPAIWLKGVHQVLKDILNV